MLDRELIIGTRASRLATRQTQLVAAAIQRAALWARVAVKTIATRGDRQRRIPLAALGGTGVFVRELEAALLTERIDLAVHSMKDLPTEATDGLIVAAVPARGDPRDALVSRHGETVRRLPLGALVGTSSPRRRAQLLHCRPDLNVVDLRGNLDTRLRRLDEGRVHAALLAAAGLRRLGLEGRIAECLPTSVFLPAVGQGALAVQIRAEDEELRRALHALDDPASRSAVAAERAFLRRVRGGCHVPFAAHATVAGERLEIEACIASPDGFRMVRHRSAGACERAEELGRRVAEALLRRAAGAMLTWGDEGRPPLGAGGPPAAPRPSPS